MFRRLKAAAVVMALALTAWSTAYAVPNLLPYQGRLTDIAGAPLNGNVTVRFALYSDSLGTTELWNESRDVTVANGLFSITLGTGTAIPASAFTGTDLFLGLRVAADAADMLPRQRVASVAFAMQAASAAFATNAGSVSNSPGIAQSHATGNATFTAGTLSAYTNLLSVTITIPTAGYIMVTGDGECGLADAGQYSSFQITETSGAGTDGGHYGYTGGTNGSGGTVTISYLIVSLHRTYFKAAGTYTFYLQGANVTASSLARLWDPTLTAIFLPVSYGSVIAAPDVADRPLFDQITRTPADTNGPGQPAVSGELVDLRELELKAARASEASERAQRQLLEARLKESKAGWAPSRAKKN
jgi:hypothetical protein